ncbi:MAG: hypothetical protein ACLFQX_09815 [Candidatus Kapaibacterium sp.]
MAKEKKQLTPEEKKREQERREREKKEYAELKKKQKEKQKRQKRREARQKKKLKQEQKRIKKKINFPYKIHFYISVLAATLFLIFFVYPGTYTPREIVFYVFLVFFLFYGGGGIAMVSVFYLISLDKEKELEEELRKQAELEKEEEARHEAELTELENIQREIEARRRKEMKESKKLPGKSAAQSSEGEDEELEGHMLPEFEMEDISDFPGDDEDQEIFSKMHDEYPEQSMNQEEMPFPEEPPSMEEFEESESGKS